jgi:alkylation response protein AidB-like acyl-CoA dehydrogenase
MALIDLKALLPGIREREARDSESYPRETVAALQGAAVPAAPFPAALGGEGCSLVAAVSAVELLATASPSAALLLSMPLGLAGLYALGPEAAPGEHRAAWQAQIDDVAARYRAGEIYAACNSEKGAGGSLAATKTVADLGPDGAWRITGEKILASSGKYATHFFSTAKVDPAQLPGCGIVEFFFISPDAPGVEVTDDWDGFGMRSTESHTVRYANAPAEGLMGFPNFLAHVQPLQYFFCLFAAIPLGCAAAIITELGTPAPQSPVLRLRLSEAVMRYEAMRAYLHQTASGWHAAAGPAYAELVLRTKTYVTQESTKLCAELFALGGGRHYRRSGSIARALADSFAGTALRPPLPLALDTLIESFSLGRLAPSD